MVRPGSNYKLYGLFVQRSMIVADFLGLELTEGVRLEDQDRIFEQLARARKLRAHRKNEFSDDAPSRDLSDYSYAKNDRAISQLYRILRGFFEIAKVGDLVVVPPLSFSQDTMIGELTDPPESFATTTFPSLYGSELLYGRHVRWLAKVPKGKLSPYFLDLVSKPNAFVLIKNSERAAIYREAFGNYILADDFRARFDVKDTEFTTTDDLYIQAFFSFVAANSMRIEQNRELLGIYQGAFERLGEYSIELQSSVNSPGYLNLMSKRISPMVAAALFVLAITVGPSAVQAAEEGQIVIGNSLDPENLCTASIYAETLQHLKLLRVERWAEACAIATQAAEATGLSGEARIMIEENDD
jgi:hypothetical protein